MLAKQKREFLTAREVKPTGWLRRQLEIQAAGLSGNLDKVWPDVRDSRWIVSRPAAVVETSSLSVTFSEVGPTSRFPSTVGLTRTPLPMAVGGWKMVADVVPPWVLSRSRYSPRRGVMVKLSSPIIRATSPEWTPAALMRYRARTVSPVSAVTVKTPSSSRMAAAAKPVRSSAPLSMALPTAATVSS